MAGVGEAQQQVFLVLAELFFQGVEIAGGLVDVVWAQMTPMQPVDWLSNDWAIMFGR